MTCCNTHCRRRARGGLAAGAWFRRSSLCWGLLMAVSLKAAEPVSDAVEISDDQGVVVAMARGDRDALQQVVAHPRNEFEQELAKVGLLRTGGRLDEATIQLQACEKAMPAQHPMRGLCSLLIAGHLFMQRRMADWQQKLEWIRRTYYPLLAKDNPGRQPTLTDAEGVQFLPGASFPAPEVSWAQASGRIPYVSAARREGLEARQQAVVEVRIQGHRHHAVIDTGAAYDTLDPAVAKALGLQPAISYQKLTDAAGKVLSAPIGILPELRLGPVTVKNWPVSMTRTPAMMVIGLPLLRRLGVVTLDAQGASLSRASDGRCTRPMLEGANISGSSDHLLYAIKVDGQPRTALIDTGGGFELLGIKSLLPPSAAKLEPKAISYAGGMRWVDSYPARVRLDLGSGPRNLDFTIMDQPFALVPYELGGEVLRHHTLVMDFLRRSVCIEPQAT